jgi:hypothetical protein
VEFGLSRGGLVAITAAATLPLFNLAKIKIIINHFLLISLIQQRYQLVHARNRQRPG